jgi:hypothetical protein
VLDVVASELIVGAKASLKETEIVVFGLMVEFFLTDIVVTASEAGAACDAVTSTSVPKSDNDAAPTGISQHRRTKRVGREKGGARQAPR